MISAAKLHKLSNINADQLVDLLLENGYDTSDEPIINTHFDGVSVGTENLYFSYQAAYHAEDGLQFANIVIKYDIDSGTISADYAG
jgi:hypothetical protein